MEPLAALRVYMDFRRQSQDTLILLLLQGRARCWRDGNRVSEENQFVLVPTKSYSMSTGMNRAYRRCMMDFLFAHDLSIFDL